MTHWILKDGILRAGRFSVSFRRTLRVPDDGRTYPLPPNLGPLPLFPIDRLREGVPDAWRQEGGFLLPLHRAEAMWIALGGAWWKPNAVKVGLGSIDALTGEPWDARLGQAPQNYLVVPDQPWLDGINVGQDRIRQFIAVPLGSGLSIEAQLAPGDERGGLRILVYEPKPRLFPDRPPTDDPGALTQASPQGMAVGAGGWIRQRVYQDRYGLHCWEPEPASRLSVHLVAAEHYAALTGEVALPMPVSAKTYADHGLPWFDLYDEGREGVAGSEQLASVEGVRKRQQELDGEPPVDEESLSLAPGTIRRLHLH
ncbi:hypothetical protein [Azospirillum sp. Marseille-Q6669]